MNCNKGCSLIVREGFSYTRFHNYGHCSFHRSLIRSQTWNVFNYNKFQDCQMQLSLKVAENTHKTIKNKQFYCDVLNIFQSTLHCMRLRCAGETYKKTKLQPVIIDCMAPFYDLKTWFCLLWNETSTILLRKLGWKF